MAPFTSPNLDTSLPNLGLLIVAAGIVYFVSQCIYNVFFHPLRSFPGPLFNRASHIPGSWYLTKGRMPIKVSDWHKTYGPVVRIAPDELAFSDPQAWKDIYGHRSAGREEFPKYDDFYRTLNDVPPSLLSAGRQEHAVLRRQISHGFSDKSLKEQEPIIGGYADLLIERLYVSCEAGTKAVNMREWLNYITFDVIGDLGFGSSFGCLEHEDYHPWITMLRQMVEQLGVIRGIAYLGPWALFLIRKLNRLGRFKQRKGHFELVVAKLKQRMQLGAERPDFIEGLLKKKNELNLPFEVLVSNANLLLIAGSETTSSLLMGVVYFLCTKPHVMEKLTREVRSAFANDAEITLSSVARLTYMLAVLNESLRRYPPIATGMPRVSPKGGDMVSGHYIPEGSVVAVWHWAINHDPRFWSDPMEFHPERFTGEPRFAGDKLEALQPFSIGPRNCIGKNLAYAEMRLIMAKIVYNFDMKLADDSKDWTRGQRVFSIWKRPDLNVYLTPVSKS